MLFSQSLNKSHPIRKACIAYLGIVVSLGFFLDYICEYYSLDQVEGPVKSAENWMLVPATIKRVGISFHSRGSVNNRVIYSYRFGDNQYENDCDNFYTGSITSFDESTCERLLGVVDGIKVYVNKKNPHESVINLNYFTLDEIVQRKYRSSWVIVVSAIALFAFFKLLLTTQLKRDPDTIAGLSL
jgi:hypothetical protein